MTLVLGKPLDPGVAAWSSMPGWGIVADLTPPELRARRSLVILRRIVAGALVLVVLVCIGGYLLAARSFSGAQSELDTATEQTGAIQTEISQHSTVTQIESATAGIDSQLAGLFTADVDVSSLVVDLTGALPAGMTITSVNVTTSSTSVSTGTTSGIGTVSLAGTAQDLNGLASYVTALNGLRGVTGVIPATNAAAKGSTSWTLTLQLTAARGAHRFGSVAPVSTTATPQTAATTDSTTGGN